jgi:PDZ domain-containing protein
MKRSVFRPRVVVLGVLAALIAGIVGLLFIIPTPYQVLLPGPVTDVQQVIQPYPKPRSGALYLTTIYSEPASVGEWLYAKTNPEAGVVPREQARPRNVSEKEYSQLLGKMLEESKVAAKVVALREAGYDVQITGQGAQVQDVTETSRAKGVLERGDIVIEADGKDVKTSGDLVALIQAHRPGETVSMRIKRRDDERRVDVPLGESPDEPGRARVGIVVLTHLYQYSLPKELDLQTKDIGGPSAGLMFALGVYNAVTPGDLVQGRKIAGTGTISSDGKVGAVGGVRYKVTAAEKAGVSIFLAPQDNYDEARGAARKMRVMPVAAFKDALQALQPV